MVDSFSVNDRMKNARWFRTIPDIGSWIPADEGTVTANTDPDASDVAHKFSAGTLVGGRRTHSA